MRERKAAAVAVTKLLAEGEKLLSLRFLVDENTGEQRKVTYPQAEIQKKDGTIVYRPYRWTRHYGKLVCVFNKYLGDMDDWQEGWY